MAKPHTNSLPEQKRLKALADYVILDTPPEDAFDDLASLAAHIAQTPVGLITFVDDRRQFFKARVGFDGDPTAPLNVGFCPDVVRARQPIVIPDTLSVPRYARNPATHIDRVRFYAGVPLTTADGHVIGTLCVLDRMPHANDFADRQLGALVKLAAQVMTQLDFRRALARRDAVLDEQRVTIAQQDALIETQAAVSTARGDLDAILDALLAGVMKAVPHADGGVIEMREGDELIYRSTRGSLDRHVGLRLPLQGSLSGHCLRTGEAVLSPDVLLDPRVKQDIVADLAMRSAIYVPVLRGGTAIGVLKLQSSRASAFAPIDLQTVRLFAGTVAGGLAEVGEATARREVRASERRYRAVFESAIDYAIVVMDLDGRVTDWNAGAHRILGWTAEEMRGEPASVFFTPEDHVAGIPDQEMHSALTEGRGIDDRWHLRRDGSRFWASGEMMALRDEAGTAIGFLKILRDRTEQRNAAAKLGASEATLRVVLDTIPVGILIAEAPSGRIVGRNARVEAIFGHAVLPSRTDEGPARWIGFHADGRCVEPGEWPLIQAAQDGASRAELEVDYQRGDGTRAWIHLSGVPMRDADGGVTGSVVVVTDIDARKRMEEQRELLNQELSHRMKNLLAMVQAIAAQTLRGATDVEAAKHVLADRLITLGKAHDLLLGGHAEAAQIGSVIRGGVGLQDDASGRIRYRGEAIEIGGKAALALALMIHELSTNAVKYGALSVPAGCVEVAWWLSSGDAEPSLHIEWQERGGPPVVAPARKGFGSRLIERGLTGAVDAKVMLTYPTDGVRCLVEAPLRNFGDTR